MMITKRDGRIVPFDRARIELAIEKAWRAELKKPWPDSIPYEIKQQITFTTDRVVSQVHSDLHVEEIQDLVEQALFEADYHVARRYILYREARTQARKDLVIIDNNTHISMHPSVLGQWLHEACGTVPYAGVLDEVIKILPPSPTTEQVFDAMIMVARTHIEFEPEYNKITARLLLRKLYTEVTGRNQYQQLWFRGYRDAFIDALDRGLKAERYDPEILSVFNLDTLASALKPERDLLFDYLGLQTLYDRYLIHVDGQRIELPQVFWMRVAMGLAIKEEVNDATERAIEFYEAMSTFQYSPSTPTLFNAGTRNPQLSSCYLTTVGDDLAQIFKAYADNAQLSKWSGGIGNDWTQVRAMGSHIKGTNGKSQGIIPFLKIANDTALAVNQGGKRKGATCAYLEPWHLDIEEFLDLRRNTGDDRRRTHDMHTAVWIPDLFMERVQANADWTLFSPDTVPALTHTWGNAFKIAYEMYEAEDLPGKRTVSALELWRAILTSLFETGHPWITFKDTANERNPQMHKGMIRSSNLCTEITLNTSAEEVAVCNLASINLATLSTQDGQLNWQTLERVITTAVRALDNVIDINYYPIPEAEFSNKQHRPVGLGIMGWSDLLHKRRIAFASEEAIELADEIMEAVSYYAIRASIKLAAERGTYPSYEGSLWDQGLFPYDTQTKGKDLTSRIDWHDLGNDLALYGMRNSNLMAIAPTATIANIQGVSQSIEPDFANLFVKSNLSGEFTVINEYLVGELRELGLWDRQMLDELKYEDGSVQRIDRIPEGIKHRFATAFEIHWSYLIAMAARRQKWIDQSQSLNLYMAEPSGKAVSEMYFEAWRKGLKTTYYLRTKAATQAEKSTIDINAHGIQPKWMKSRSASSEIVVERTEFNPDEFLCEACQ